MIEIKMSTGASAKFDRWRKRQPTKHHKILKIAIEDSLEKGEHINTGVAEQIIRATNEIINQK